MVHKYGVRPRRRLTDGSRWRPSSSPLGCSNRRPYSKGVQQDVLNRTQLLGRPVQDVLLQPNAPSSSSLYRWIKHFEVHDEIPIKTREDKKARRGCDRLDGLRTMTAPIRTILLEIMRQERFLYLDEYQYKLLVKSGVRVATSTIWETLHDKLGYSKREFTAKASQRDEELRAAFRRQVRTIPNIKDVVWIDETANNRNAYQCKRGWERGGKKFCISKYFSPRGPQHATLLAAADIEGPILSMCELVLRKVDDADGDPTHGTIDQERFEQWVREVLIPRLEERMACLGRQATVILDNASIHYSDVVLRLLRDAGVRVIFLPPYSPDYNPIELVFGVYKAFLKRWYKTGKYARKLSIMHMDALCSVSKEDMHGMVRHSYCYRNLPRRRRSQSNSSPS
jgi:transposase